MMMCLPILFFCLVLCTGAQNSDVCGTYDWDDEFVCSGHGVCEETDVCNCDSNYYFNISLGKEGNFTLCLSCPDGTGRNYSSSDIGVSACPLCPNNTFSISDTTDGCVVCPAGEIGTNNRVSCIPCPTGTYNPFSQSGDCLSCPIEYCCPFVGTTTPTHCPIGYYCPEVGLENPIPCQDGYYTLATGASTQDDCVEGYHCFTGYPIESLDESQILRITRLEDECSVDLDQERIRDIALRIKLGIIKSLTLFTIAFFSFWVYFDRNVTLFRFILRFIILSRRKKSADENEVEKKKTKVRFELEGRTKMRKIEEIESTSELIQTCLCFVVCVFPLRSIKFKILDCLFHSKHCLADGDGQIKKRTSLGGVLSVLTIVVLIGILSWCFVDFIMDRRIRTTNVSVRDYDPVRMNGTLVLTVKFFGNYEDDFECQSLFFVDGIRTNNQEEDALIKCERASNNEVYDTLRGCECVLECVDCVIVNSDSLVQFQFIHGQYEVIRLITYSVALPSFSKGCDEEEGFEISNNIFVDDEGIDSAVVELVINRRKYHELHFAYPILPFDIFTRTIHGISASISSSDFVSSVPLIDPISVEEETTITLDFTYSIALSDSVKVIREEFMDDYLNFLTRIFSLFGGIVACVGFFFSCCDSFRVSRSCFRCCPCNGRKRKSSSTVTPSSVGMNVDDDEEEENNGEEKERNEEEEELQEKYEGEEYEGEEDSGEEEEEEQGLKKDLEIIELKKQMKALENALNEVLNRNNNKNNEKEGEIDDEEEEEEDKEGEELKEEENDDILVFNNDEETGEENDEDSHHEDEVDEEGEEQQQKEEETKGEEDIVKIEGDDVEIGKESNNNNGDDEDDSNDLSEQEEDKEFEEEELLEEEFLEDIMDLGVLMGAIKSKKEENEKDEFFDYEVEGEVGEEYFLFSSSYNNNFELQDDNIDEEEVKTEGEEEKIDTKEEANVLQEENPYITRFKKTKEYSNYKLQRKRILDPLVFNIQDIRSFLRPPIIIVIIIRTFLLLILNEKKTSKFDNNNNNNKGGSSWNDMKKYIGSSKVLPDIKSYEILKSKKRKIRVARKVLSEISRKRTIRACKSAGVVYDYLISIVEAVDKLKRIMEGEEEEEVKNEVVMVGEEEEDAEGEEQPKETEILKEEEDIFDEDTKKEDPREEEEETREKYYEEVKEEVKVEEILNFDQVVEEIPNEEKVVDSTEKKEEETKVQEDLDFRYDTDEEEEQQQQEEEDSEDSSKRRIVNFEEEKIKKRTRRKKKRRKKKMKKKYRLKPLKKKKPNVEKNTTTINDDVPIISEIKDEDEKRVRTSSIEPLIDNVNGDEGEKKEYVGDEDVTDLLVKNREFTKFSDAYSRLKGQTGLLFLKFITSYLKSTSEGVTKESIGM